jgi:hypothetical protein
VWRGVVADDDVLQALAGEVFVPMIEGQEALQVPRRDSGCQGDGLAAFFTKVRQLPVDVCSEMCPRIASSKTIVKLFGCNRPSAYAEVANCKGFA